MYFNKFLKISKTILQFVFPYLHQMETVGSVIYIYVYIESIYIEVQMNGQ